MLVCLFTGAELVHRQSIGLNTLMDVQGHCPPATLPEIIKKAILGSPHQGLTLNDIVQAIKERFAYYILENEGWPVSSSILFIILFQRMFLHFLRSYYILILLSLCFIPFSLSHQIRPHQSLLFQHRASLRKTLYGKGFVKESHSKYTYWKVANNNTYLPTSKKSRKGMGAPSMTAVDSPVSDLAMMSRPISQTSLLQPTATSSQHLPVQALQVVAETPTLIQMSTSQAMTVEGQLNPQIPQEQQYLLPSQRTKYYTLWDAPLNWSVNIPTVGNKHNVVTRDKGKAPEMPEDQYDGSHGQREDYRAPL